ncbi:hypothetical protein CJU41_00960 [Pseudomonas aeruginosa]|nr:hypothetical protein CJU40_00960 [Pseudomonas aeruginosa]PCA39222.1 hypothetical protein CJU41_00960 [Pseudomonas aeruginosa]PCA40944.1 hypothetical protein CJU39_22825 [Pseudomonas aeruginosa]
MASVGYVRRTTLAGAFISFMGCGGITVADSAERTAASPMTAASGDSGDSGSAVLNRANAFIATLSNKQRADLIQEYTFANAARWHTYPQWGLSRRQARLGLRLGTLSDAQWIALNALLAAATGSGKNEGYDEIQQHLAVDDWIGQNGGGDGYGRGNFFVAFLSTPSQTGVWQLQFGGHHLALTNTYRGGTLIGATPSFRAIEPHTPIQYGGVALQPQRDEWAAFVALLASLNPAQATAARLATKQSELLLGPEARNKDWNFPAKPEGVAAAHLSAGQRALLLKSIGLYVNDVADADAARILAHYERELDATYLGFSGSTSLTRTGDYVRIDGPSVWIELVMDPPYSSDQPHVHAVWRDKHTDYGGTRPNGPQPFALFKSLFASWMHT